MRKVVDINEGWKFIKEDMCSSTDVPLSVCNEINELRLIGLEQAALLTGTCVNLPHTWNALDGQDGGDDYYRGHCYYVKHFECPQHELGDEIYIEFSGVNSSASVMLNSQLLGCHDGGYSTFRVNITKTLITDNNKLNTIIVAVDNSENDRIYPQKADFTFYGGIYRDVRLVIVQKMHFDLDYYGSIGVRITPEIIGKSISSTGQPVAQKAVITVDAWINDAANGKMSVIIEGDREPIYTEVLIYESTKQASAFLVIENPHLWDGRRDPFLYHATVQLIVDDSLIDEVVINFGCRTFWVDPENGFFLNGNSYPLRGVSRHQDREGLGNALTNEMHDEDMNMIIDMGANSIRLAHYQHDQYFYDLCDKYGMVVWAEIPYITKHMNNGWDNTIQQMKELVVQNYHHASICFFGISNEVTAGGMNDAIIENNYALEALVKKLDKTRLSTIACAFMLDEASEMLRITDTIAYNHYFGWYMGEVEDNDEWFDDFHKKHPELSVGLSEYGAEAVIKWQTGKPERGDYTEQYQALYHEHMLSMITNRSYLWCTYVWNMFDFAADGRDEGGVKGRNNKGLVTFDRKIKKDAYYLYKAYWSSEPFVYITSRRYVNRTEEVSEVKVYSNQKQVELYHNGKLVEIIYSKSVKHPVFRFQVRLEPENEIIAKSGEVIDSIHITKVDKADTAYSMELIGDVANWLDGMCIDIKEGYFSLEDKVSELIKIPEGNELFRKFIASYDKRKQGTAAAVHISEEQRMMTMRSMKLIELTKRTNTPPDEVQLLLNELQKIKK